MSLLVDVPRVSLSRDTQTTLPVETSLKTSEDVKLSELEAELNYTRNEARNSAEMIEDLKRIHKAEVSVVFAFTRFECSFHLHSFRV